MASLSDRFNINAQLEHLQAKYVGTGHPDINRFEVRARGSGVQERGAARPPNLQAAHSGALSKHPFLTAAAWLHNAHCTHAPPRLPVAQWNLNIKRDTYASLIGHQTLAAYHAIAENESIGRVKYNFLQVGLLRGASGAGDPQMLTEKGAAGQTVDELLLVNKWRPTMPSCPCSLPPCRTCCCRAACRPRRRRSDGAAAASYVPGSRLPFPSLLVSRCFVLLASALARRSPLPCLCSPDPLTPLTQHRSSIYSASVNYICKA